MRTVPSSAKYTAALVGILLGCLLGGPISGTASAADGPCYSPPSKPGAVSHVNYSGMKSMLFCYGPMTVRPGQNTIGVDTKYLMPKVPGWITRFDPDLIYADPKKGTKGVPHVDVIHLHHAIWSGMGDDYPRWSGGEEKSILQLPKGFGWLNDPTKPIELTHMIHNQYPTTEKVYLTWRIDFVPATSPDAAKIKRVQTLWLDVTGFKLNGFSALRGTGSAGKFTFPDQATPEALAQRGDQNHFIADQDMTLVEAVGHLHPGGLTAELKVLRGAASRTIFTSSAKYWEPAGAVSWDVALTATPANWRVKVKSGDVLVPSATYDVSKSSWYESMGVIPVFANYGDSTPGKDPFLRRLVSTTGKITHGHLAENNHHGGNAVTGATIATALPNGQSSDGSTIPISDFIYSLGDFSNSGAALNPPTVTAGGSFTFRNDDVTGDPTTDYAYHTITACANPCNRATGISYPRADGPVEFDSGQLGSGPIGATVAAQRRTWTIPNDLPTGTYSYFCRVHPYMRGAFRVVPK